MDIAFCVRDENEKLKILFTRSSQNHIPRVGEIIYFQKKEYMIEDMLWNYDENYIGYIISLNRSVKDME